MVTVAMLTNRNVFSEMQFLFTMGFFSYLGAIYPICDPARTIMNS